MSFARAMIRATRKLIDLEDNLRLGRGGMKEKDNVIPDVN